MNEQLPDNPQETLDHIRAKMKSVATDFAEGRINRAQFNAIYAHYSEQQTIISRLIEKDPDNPAWRHVAAPGHTSFLRTHFEAQILFYVVFKHQNPRPLVVGGKEPGDARKHVSKLLKSLWEMPNIPQQGLARVHLKDGRFMAIATGPNAVTVMFFSLTPSTTQLNRLRDTHSDFERANRYALERNQPPDKMVFPQRALLT